MPIAPSEYSRTGAYELLSAAARGHIAVDRRLIAALTADPARTLPDLIRFSRENHGEDRFDLTPDLLYLFCLMPSPEAIPLLVEELRREPNDASSEAVDLAVILGEPAANAALDLFDETGRSHSELVYVGLMAGARGARVDEAIAHVASTDPDEGAFLKEMAAEEYDREGYAPEAEYPEVAEPDLFDLPEAEREEFLTSASPELRRLAAASYEGEELSDRRRQDLLEMGKNDPDARVRGAAWEALRDQTTRPPVIEAMVARLKAATDPHERACLASALTYHTEIPGVVEAIEEAYAQPAYRAKALQAMWRSLDPLFVDRPPLHLDDPDPEVRRHAVLGVGYFHLRNETKRLERLFFDSAVREDALFAYALAAPAEDNALGMRQLEKRIEELADGLDEGEYEALQSATDLRLELAGRGRGGASKQAVSTKVGRNDPCPCGSGKKYKKCCGSAA